MSVRFEGNSAVDNRRKERSALKRNTRVILDEISDDDETPEEIEFKEAQRLLDETAKEAIAPEPFFDEECEVVVRFGG